MTVDDTKATDLQTTTPQGTPSMRRLATPAAARSLFNRMVDEDMRGGAQHRAIIQGMIDGNPPFSDEVLEEMGMGNSINVNFLTMRANLDARAGAGHELFAEVPSIIDCKPLKVLHNEPEVVHNCSIIAEEFTDLVTLWDGFLPAMEMVWRNCDAYGIGVCAWPDPWDWRPQSFQRGNLLVDPQASVEVDKNDFVMIRDELSVHDLFIKTQDPDTSRARGWKVQSLKDLIVRVFHAKEGTSDDDQYQRSTWESIQQAARNNDPYYQSQQFDKVRVVHILVREVSGDQKVSHLIIPELGSCDYFIFEGLDQYDRMSHVLWWMPYNYGDGYVRSVRGVASYMIQHDDLSNRFLCRIFDAGFLSASLLLQPQTPMDMSRLQFMQMGPYTIVPSELNIRQSTFQPQISPLLQLRSVSEQVMKNNTGTFRQHSESVGREAEKTARQVAEEANKEARFEKAAIAARYTHLDKLYREIFRRATSKEILDSGNVEYPGAREAKAFIQRCEDRGVPREFITNWQKNFRVSAYRAVGMGSLGVKYDITGQILNMSGSFDELGKREALREAVAARVGYRHVDRFVPTLDRDQNSSNEHSIAMLEFNDIEEGSEVVVGSDQLHKIHIMVFLQRLYPLMEAALAGQPTPDPVRDFRTMQLAVQHIAQHAQYLMQDPRQKEFIDTQLKPILQKVSEAMQVLEQSAKQVLKAQQQQQQQQEAQLANAEKIQQDRELEAKIFEIQRKYEVEAMKQQSLNSMRAAKTEEQMAIARHKAEEDIKRKAEKQAAEIRINAEKARADAAIKQARQS